ncbi:hypothetical protein MUU47_07165 [Scandinavium sp. H11S7]|uniref:Uncharacterized protein n=1 Tax=Scandinavium hiltneri TaxID=2926519 RepID=A0ABT2DZ65_9ENTR|nr:hypothetical protein [Scandinavium hiltneri]MCS2160909.1 hypothetical protein [Scandinavium hiltneri]
MYSNKNIIDALQVNKIMAVKLDEALSGVKDDVLAQLGRINAGATRLTYYASCFTDNYRDVCSRLRDEDVRFLFGIAQLVKRRNVIFDMIHMYIDSIIKYKSYESIQNIKRHLMRLGVKISVTNATNEGLSFAITTAICYGFGFRPAVQGKLNKYSIAASIASIAGVYGLVQEAANCANHIKKHNPLYYHSLYSAKLEMMYFLIEPLIRQGELTNRISITDEDAARLIARLV